MKYPKKLDKKSIIGVCAPSDGFIDTKYKLMCDRAKKDGRKKE